MMSAPVLRRRVAALQAGRSRDSSLSLLGIGAGERILDGEIEEAVPDRPPGVRHDRSARRRALRSGPLLTSWGVLPRN